MLNLAVGLHQKGLEVDLVLVSKEGAYIEQVPSGIKIVNFGKSRVLFSIPALYMYLKKAKPTVLLSAMNHVNIAAIIAARLFSRSLRLIISERSHVSSIASAPFPSKKWFVTLLLRRLYRYADMVIAVSEGVRKSLIAETGLPDSKVICIYNPLPINTIKEKSFAPLAHPWFQGGTMPVILAVGRLSEEKEFVFLISSLAKMLIEMPARLVIIGEGHMRGRLVSLIKELSLEQYVDLPGFTDNPYAYMKRASVLVLSSSSEGLPNVLLEAMACGCPVVSTDCPSGPAEILDYGRYGLLVPVGDIDGLAQAIQKVLANPPDKKLLEQRALMFSADKISEQYLDVLLG